MMEAKRLVMKQNEKNLKIMTKAEKLVWKEEIGIKEEKEIYGKGYTCPFCGIKLKEYYCSNCDR